MAGHFTDRTLACLNTVNVPWWNVLGCAHQPQEAACICYKTVAMRCAQWSKILV
jgi:hypothetical protein